MRRSVSRPRCPRRRGVRVIENREEKAVHPQVERHAWKLSGTPESRVVRRKFEGRGSNNASVPTTRLSPHSPSPPIRPERRVPTTRLSPHSLLNGSNNASVPLFVPRERCDSQVPTTRLSPHSLLNGSNNASVPLFVPRERCDSHAGAGAVSRRGCSGPYGRARHAEPCWDDRVPRQQRSLRIYPHRDCETA